MAYIATVSKASVKEIASGQFIASIVGVVIDDALPAEEQEVFRKVASKRYKTGDPISTVQPFLMSQIQKAWDTYQNEQNIFNAPAFDTMVTTIETAFNTYIS